MIHIVFTVTNDLTYDQRMQRICSTLAEDGYKVTLIGRKLKKSVDLTTKTFEQKRLNLFFNKGKLFYLEYNLRLFFFLLFKKFDIACAIDLDSIAPVYCASRIKSKIVVYDAHEYFTEVIEVVNRPLTKKIWLWVEKTFVPKVDYAYTVSEGLQQLFSQRYNKHFDLIRNISVLEEYKPLEKKEKYLIYAGAVNEGRGLEECIDAIKDIECKLYICGEGDIYNNLIEKVKKLNLEDKIIFTGYVEPQKLKMLIRESYIGLLLLENKSISYYYSLANKFFDYIHAGIPQITIDFPEYKLLNEKYQVAQLIPLDVTRIKETINLLLHDNNLYQKLVRNTFLAREELNWQKESQKLKELYAKMLP